MFATTPRTFGSVPVQKIGNSIIQLSARGIRRTRLTAFHIFGNIGSRPSCLKTLTMFMCKTHNSWQHFSENNHLIGDLWAVANTSIKAIILSQMAGSISRLLETSLK